MYLRECPRSIYRHSFSRMTCARQISNKTNVCDTKLKASTDLDIFRYTMYCVMTQISKCDCLGYVTNHCSVKRSVPIDERIDRLHIPGERESIFFTVAGGAVISCNIPSVANSAGLCSDPMGTISFHATLEFPTI